MARANATYARLPFDEAIAYLANKQAVDTNSYKDITGIGHDAAFVVAGAKGALLNDLHQATVRAVAEGETLAEFKQKFNGIVAQRGWSHTGNADWRAAVIWRSNLRASYAAGRIERQEDPDVQRLRPFRQWVHGGTRNPRHSHLAMNGKVFPSDHPFWQTSYPPVFQGRFEYGCRCQVYTLSQRDLDREGLTVEQPPNLSDTLPWTDPETGASGTVTLPATPGPGRAPGRTTAAERAQVLEQITRGLNPEIAAQVIQAVEAIPLPPAIAAPQVAAAETTVEVVSKIKDIPRIRRAINFEDDKALITGRLPFQFDPVMREMMGEPKPKGLPYMSILFTVNDSFTPPNATDRQKMRIMSGIRRALKEEFARLPDGVIVHNSPIGGATGKRASIYARAGFGPVDKDGDQWGIIKSGKVSPLTRAQYRSLKPGSKI